MKIHKKEDGKKSVEINAKQLMALFSAFGAIGAGSGQAIDHYLGYDLFSVTPMSQSEKVRIEQIDDMRKRIKYLEDQVDMLGHDLNLCLRKTHHLVDTDLDITLK